MSQNFENVIEERTESPSTFGPMIISITEWQLMVDIIFMYRASLSQL